MMIVMRSSLRCKWCQLITLHQEKNLISDKWSIEDLNSKNIDTIFTKVIVIIFQVRHYVAAGGELNPQPHPYQAELLWLPEKYVIV